jgi:hypothetical protein
MSLKYLFMESAAEERTGPGRGGRVVNMDWVEIVEPGSTGEAVFPQLLQKAALWHQNG